MFERWNVGRLEGWKFGGDVAGAVVAKVGETGVGGEGLDHEGPQMRCEPKASAVPAVVIVLCPERAICHSIRRPNCFGTIRCFPRARGPKSRANGGKRWDTGNCSDLLFEFNFWRIKCCRLKIEG
jgi:hypothetical protein